MNGQIQVILLPGLHGSAALFAAFIAAAPAWAEPVAVDYPQDIAADYAALSHLAGNCIDFGRPFVVVGESFSGPVALQIAAGQPANLLGMVLSGTFVTNPRPLLGSLCSRKCAEKLLSLPMPARLVNWLLLGQCADNALLQQVMAAIKAAGPKLLAARLDMIVRADFRAALAQCAVPVLYLRALQDRVVAEKSLREILRIAPKTQVVTVESGHFMLQTRPEQCWQAISAMLSFPESVA